ncbi:SDR family NAD(P)-dependent oxidoreductase [Candidatus Oscillochloris fontis]|uniref:SDR family NAD(P)-dependent oxidoreductase n=1 Tax=Candidatus Oscillochloris fontis TaxID=2496868 RepID=UPI00101C20ED|nr:SDR family NAD(P)-dependent oxidoreductase [Candidatus Oscillochloris fontis]
MTRLEDKIALITGGAGTIGEVITQRYLEEGATVVITGRNRDKLDRYRERLITEFQALPERVMVVRMDGSSNVEVRTGIAAVVAHFGRIDILVNNAGSSGARQPLPTIPLRRSELQADETETLADSIGNLIGITWNLIRAVAPFMSAGSSVINISTVFARTDYYGRIPYVVPKAALHALTLAAATELGEQGIRVNQINPGPIESERIRNVFQRMDELKGLPEQSTAEGFFQIMRLRRPNAEGYLAKGFPKPLDVANVAVFLGSAESAALSGETLDVTHGMAVPVASRTTLTSRPGLRAVDGSGHTSLICVGDQIEEAAALTGVLRACGAEVVIGFRSRAAIARFDHLVEHGRHLPSQEHMAPVLLYLNPTEPESIDQALRWMATNLDLPTSVIILPAQRQPLPPSVVRASDEDVAYFLRDELGSMIVMASRLARFWQQATLAPGSMPFQPRVLFITNPDDGQGNLYAEMLRAGVEQLCRVWRHEAQSDYARLRQTHEQPPLIRPVWANQLVRFANREQENLEYCCAWVAKILLSERTIEELNLYLPHQIGSTTGSRQPSFGWAENLIGLHLGKTALITGGSAGIGGQIARLLALSGARVMLCARDERRLIQMREMIIAELSEVGYNRVESRVQICAACDVGEEAQLTNLVQHTLDLFGHVDYLINNAGIAGAEEMVLDLPLEAWQCTLRTNLISNYSLIHKLAPQMKSRGSGYILNVSSYFGGEKYSAIPYPNRADYAVSKAGQRALAEALARLLGPEVQMNTMAPGPVEGERLRGSGDRPGLFMRRGRLILENKRLNDLHATLIEAERAGEGTMSTLLAHLLHNDVAALLDDPAAPPRLRTLAERISEQRDPTSFAGTSFMNGTIATKLLARLFNADQIDAQTFQTSQPHLPPEPFFARSQIDREARRVRDGVMSMLYLQRMPTEFDVALATVYYLSDRSVSGETFHPSGGLRHERTPTGAELYGSPSPQRLASLAGSTVYLIGESMASHLEALVRAYLERYAVAQVVLICATPAGAERLGHALTDHVASGTLAILSAEAGIETALSQAIHRFGAPGPVVSTPFRPLPNLPLIGRNDSDWSNVLDVEGFAELCADQLTHHFRITRKLSLVAGVSLVLVTPETDTHSSTEQFALANFVKTTLHAFTATVGVECERTAHRILVNQVDLGRQARAEEPRSPSEQAQEMERFIDAIMLTTAPIPTEEDNRYTGRIYRGRAITV